MTAPPEASRPAPGVRVVTFGEMLLRLQAPGHERLLRSPRLEATFGGSEINVAVALSCMGADAHVVTVVPDSPLGERAREVLRAHGVTVHSPDAGGRLGLYFAERGRPPRPAAVVYDRAGSAFAKFDAWARAVRWPDILQGAHWFHTSGITPPLSEEAHRATADALEAAHAVGARTSFDLNYRGALWADEAAAGEALRPLLVGLDLLVVNTYHLRTCFGWDVDPNAGEAGAALEKAAEDLGVGAMALTHRCERADGSQIWSASLAAGGAVAHSTTWTVTPVERIGGGDAFTAGLLYALGSERSAQEAIHFAAAAGALKLTEPGDWSTAKAPEIEAALAGNTTGIRR